MYWCFILLLLPHCHNWQTKSYTSCNHTYHVTFSSILYVFYILNDVCPTSILMLGCSDHHWSMVRYDQSFLFCSYPSWAWNLYYPYTSHVSLLPYVYMSIIPFLVSYYYTSHSIVIHLHFFDWCTRRCICCNILCTTVSEIHLRVESSSLMQSAMIESVHVSMDDILYAQI